MNQNYALHGYAKEIAMSPALKEKPFAEELPVTGAAGMILDGRYLHLNGLACAAGRPAPIF